MSWLISKFQLLLLLAVALAATACAADNKQDTAVRPTADQMEPTPSQDVPEQENWDTANTSAENPAATPPQTGSAVPPSVPDPISLPVIAPAPAWHNDTWINTDTPLPLEDLRGKVVLLEFWTFG